jgi:uncharacterized protein YbaR (Trm112 family)
MPDRPTPLIDPELLDILACPACHSALELVDDKLRCSPCGRLFRIDDGIPILLLEESETY